MSREDGFGEMGALIDDDTLSLFCTWGTPDDVADRLIERYGTHATRLRPPASATELVPLLRARIR